MKAKFGVPPRPHHRLPRAGRRRGGQRSRRRQGRPEDRGEVDQPVRLARSGDGPRQGHRRRGRRESAPRARLAAAGARPAHREVRRAARLHVRGLARRTAARRGQARGAVQALRLQDLAEGSRGRRGCGAERRDAGRRGGERGARRAALSHADRRRRDPRVHRKSGAVRPGRVRHRDHVARSARRAAGRHVVRHRARARRSTCRSRTSIAGAPAQLGAAARLALLRPWLEDAARAKVGQNLKYDQHVLANHGMQLAASRTTRCWSPTCSKATAATTWTRSPSAICGEKTISYDDVTGKGANRIGFEQVDVRAATEYSAEDADVTLRLHQRLYPQLAADAKLEFVYREHRDAGARDPVPHGAQRRAGRRATSSRRRAANSARR